MTDNYPLPPPPDAFFGLVLTPTVDSISTREDGEGAGVVIDFGQGIILKIRTAAKACELIDAAVDALQILDPSRLLGTIRELSIELDPDYETIP